MRALPPACVPDALALSGDDVANFRGLSGGAAARPDRRRCGRRPLRRAPSTRSCLASGPPAEAPASEYARVRVDAADVRPPKRPVAMILALDVGERRIGIAVSDPAESYALPLRTLERTTHARRSRRDRRRRTRVRAQRTIVVGDPVHAFGRARHRRAEDRCASWRASARAYGGAIERVDERLTTAQATRTLVAADVSRAGRKRVVDQLAAALILEAYLARKRRAATLMRRAPSLVAALLLVAAVLPWCPACCGSAASVVRGPSSAGYADHGYRAERSDRPRDCRRLLAARHVIASAFAFELLARLRGERSRMEAGQFRFDAAPHAERRAAAARCRRPTESPSGSRFPKATPTRRSRKRWPMHRLGQTTQARSRIRALLARLRRTQNTVARRLPLPRHLLDSAQRRRRRDREAC